MLEEKVVRELIVGLHEHKEEVRNRWIEMMDAKETRCFDPQVPQNLIEQTSRRFTDLMTASFSNEVDVDSEKSAEFAEKIIQLGWSMDCVNVAIETFSAASFDILEEKDVLRQDNLRVYIEMYLSWVEPLRKSIIHSYTEEWERTVRLQRVALQELSASLIPVFDRVSIMPLVGTVDTERAKLIIENLLEGVVEQRAEVVLLDITGVPIVDTMVAHHLIQAAEAVRLVGAKCLLVGIRPEIAQTIVTLGIDLTNFSTTSTLERGVQEALRLTNRKIVEVNKE